MKDQYFGDVNDFRKYGLLRILAEEGGLRLGVHWMLTPPDGRTDGGKVGYLTQPEVWRAHDPKLFDALATSLLQESRRSVQVMDDRRLIQQCSYFSELVPDHAGARRDGFERMRKTFTGTDLVFFDPDNGLEVPSCPAGRKGSSKYLLWEEVQTTFQDGASLLIFQHYARVERTAFTRDLAYRLAAKTGAACILALSTAHVLFLLVLQPRHQTQALTALRQLQAHWGGQFRVFDAGVAWVP